MASFNWATCEILMTAGAGRYHGTKADLANVPKDANATMSFAHEYVHFLQLIGSLSGLHLLGEIIDLGVKGALLLSGHTEGERITVRHQILPLLSAQPDKAGSAHPTFTPRLQYLKEQAAVLFTHQDYSYGGAEPPWSLVQQVVTVGGYIEPFVGIVTPRGTFRPITPGMLAEGMARRIDQLLKKNSGFTVHVWDGSYAEQEFYNGIRTVLTQPQYAHNVVPATLERLTIVLCCLALGSVRPDWAMAVMLGRLKDKHTAGGLVSTIAITLRDLLMSNDVALLNARPFNEVIDDLQHGAGNVIDRTEYLPIYEQLKNIHRASNLVFAHPEYFADESIGWGHIREWMSIFTIPSVVADDGDVDSIDGVLCTPTVTDYLREIVRVFF